MKCTHPNHPADNPRTSCTRTRTYNVMGRDELSIIRHLLFWALEGVTEESKLNHQSLVLPYSSGDGLPEEADLDVRVMSGEDSW